MPPNPLDSTVNPCLEHVKYLKLFEWLCEGEYSSRKRRVGRKTRRGRVKYSMVESVSNFWLALCCCAADYCERNMDSPKLATRHICSNKGTSSVRHDAQHVIGIAMVWSGSGLAAMILSSGR
jgi:hypothetical protein